MLSHLKIKADWSHLRTIGNSFPARLSLAAPFVGYIIIFNDVFIGAIRNSTGAAGLTPSAFPLTPYFYFYGLISFSIGSLIYSLFCPPVIKLYANHDVYIRSHFEDMSPNELLDICAEIRTSDYHDKLRLNYITTIIGSNSAISRDMKREIFYMHFKCMNSSKIFAYFFSYSLFLIGFVFLAIPSAIFFVRITKTL